MNGDAMNEDTEFPFDRARRVTSEENTRFRQALTEQFGLNLKERQSLENIQNNDQLITLKLDPKVVAWVKKETKKRKISDQKLINEILLQQCDE